MYNRDSKIMRKLLGKTAADTSAGDLAVAGTPASDSASARASSSGQVAFRRSQSQHAVYPVGAPIACLDVSPDRRAAVLAGRHLLKTMVLDDPRGGSGFNCVEGVDIRAAITAQQGSASRASIVADQLNIRDAKWHGNSSIFTACASGRILNYDVARLASGSSEPLDYVQIQEDSRQVNTLDVNPHLRNWLLSGSQDGMARVFDASTPWQNRSGVLTFRQRFVPLKSIDSVRQVKWSPRIGHEMACCTEAGVVLKWDVRQASRPLLRINAHEKACTSIAWHPDGVHLISAGWDARLHVWDLGNTADRRQKPKWTIATPAAVSAVAWRPGLWSATAQSRRVAQVAVSYDESSSRRFGTPIVHIWDLARPTMPYKEVERFESSPMALSWQDQDILWTVGQDGLFSQCDVAFAPKVVDRLSTSASAFSPRGDTLVFLDERSHPSRIRPSISHPAESGSRRSYGSSTNTQMLSLSRSDSEEDAVGSFLGPRRLRHHRRKTSARPGPPVSTTPPSGSSLSDDSRQTLGLEQGINLTGMFRPQQAMAYGRIPGAKSASIYPYLSSLYLETLERDLPYVEGGKGLAQRVGAIMEQYARGAENVSLFRLAQTWRVLAYVMSLLLKKRAQYHLEARLSYFQNIKVEDKRSSDTPNPPDTFSALQVTADDIPRRPSATANSFDARSGSILRSLLSEEIDSTSNVPTPLAKPVDSSHGIEYQDQYYQHGRKLTPIVEPESFDIGPAAHASYKGSPRKRLDSTPMSLLSQGSDHSQSSITEGYDFYDAEALALAIDVPGPKQAAKPRWDGTGSAGSKDRSTVARQDSEESYGQLFSISEGTKQPATTPSDAAEAGQDEAHELPETQSSAEFESRIRGHEIDSSSPVNNRRITSIMESPEDVFMISQTTAATENDTYPSQASFASQTDSDFHHSNGQSLDTEVEARPATSNNRSASPQKPVVAFERDTRHHIVESDYLQWESDPPYPYLSSFGAKAVASPPSPLDPYTLLSRALNYECRTSALNASAMILLLKPLVPESVIDTFQATAILRQHCSRLMGMGLFVEAALLRKLCVQGWPAGLPGWGESYSSIFAPAQDAVKAGFFCSNCRKPREVDPASGDEAAWTCERCKSIMAPCAVCSHRKPELASHRPVEIVDGPRTAAAAADEDLWAQWWYCPGCAHGGHASCLQTWHAPVDSSSTSDLSPKYSDGCCPLDGCGHACLPGKYRGETTTARADELGRAAVESSRSSRDERAASGVGGGTGSGRSSPRPERAVRTDGNDVAQSRAVGVVRETLNKGTAGGGILSSSPGRSATPAERERRKSVKFARTE